MARYPPTRPGWYRNPDEPRVVALLGREILDRTFPIPARVGQEG